MTHPPIDVADSLEGRAVAQWAFGYFINRRVPGTAAGGMACLLALSVMAEFVEEAARRTPATPASKLAAVKRAVAQFLTDTAPDKSQQDALTDVVLVALNSAETALADHVRATDAPVTAH